MGASKKIRLYGIGCTKCLGNIWAKEGRRCVKHEPTP